jgi:adenosylcobinamide-GDP ribazoletransferase
MKKIINSFLSTLSFFTRFKLKFNFETYLFSFFLPFVFFFCNIFYIFSLFLLNHIRLNTFLLSILTFIFTYYYFNLFHFDGFTDFIDAAFSQKDNINKRVEILKDVHKGSFAIFFGSFYVLIKFLIILNIFGIYYYLLYKKELSIFDNFLFTKNLFSVIYKNINYIFFKIIKLLKIGKNYLIINEKLFFYEFGKIYIYLIFLFLTFFSRLSSFFTSYKTKIIEKSVLFKYFQSLLDKKKFYLGNFFCFFIFGFLSFFIYFFIFKNNFKNFYLYFYFIYLYLFLYLFSITFNLIFKNFFINLFYKLFDGMNGDCLGFIIELEELIFLILFIFI